jgi:hypothetical protein
MIPMRRQPASRARINWANPITQGLEFAYLPGTLTDATGKSPRASFQGNGRPEVRGGTILNFAGTNAGVQVGTGAPLLGPLNNSTIVAIGIALKQASLYCERPSSGNDIYKLESYSGGSQFTYRNDGGSLNQLAAPGTNAFSGVVRIFAATKNNNIHKAYCGAVNHENSIGMVTGIYTAYNSPPTMTNAGMVRSIAYDIQDPSAYLHGRLDLVAGWSRTLSDDEIRSLQANPWQIFAASSDDADLARLASAAPSGPLSFNYTAVGGFVLSGSAERLRGASSAPVGGLTLSGTAPRSRGRTPVASSGILLGGAAPAQRAAVRSAAGGTVFSGSASVGFVRTVKSLVVTPLLSIALRGSANVARTCTRLVSGGLSLAGHAVSAAGAAGAIIASMLPAFIRRRRR